MDALGSSDIFLFEDFRLDRWGLFRRDQAGAFAPTKIGSRALDILRMLLEWPGEVVSKVTLLDAVWPEAVVEDSNLTVQIASLRRVLDQGRGTGSCIQTVSGRGYRFVPPVMRHSKSTTDTPGVGAHAIPRLSVVVLPFANLSLGPDQEYLTDAITDDLTAGLSRIADSFVIARTTALTYKGKAVD